MIFYINYKKFNTVIIGLVVVTILMVWPVNYVIDPYGKNNSIIFSGNINKFVRDERISKFKLIKKYRDATSFIFGSSRALMLDPVKLGKLTGTKALNLAFSSASVEEYYLYIKYLLQTRKVKNIIIGIDLFSYTKNFKSNGVLPSELLAELNIDDGHSFKDYLSFKMLIRSWDTLKNNYGDTKPPVSIYSERGKIIINSILNLKLENKEQYINKHVINAPPRWGSKNAELSIRMLNKLRMIKNMCNEKQVKLFLFMSPIYINQILMKKNRFAEQKELLSYIVNNISPVYDFNNINDLNLSPYSFMDQFHYTYDVADIIVDEIFSGKHSENNKGVLVTSSNLEQHINSVDKKLREVQQGNI